MSRGLGRVQLKVVKALAEARRQRFHARSTLELANVVYRGTIFNDLNNPITLSQLQTVQAALRGLLKRKLVKRGRWALSRTGHNTWEIID
jgi:hypothetical protein